MKAYVDSTGQTRMFRPEMNMKRLNDSCARLCLPAFNGAELLVRQRKLKRVETRDSHSSTFQLDVSTFCGIRDTLGVLGDCSDTECNYTAQAEL
jgi:branched-subunit amino acid aminotransferase/4-amino-4-deoxychorismate lyase